MNFQTSKFASDKGRVVAVELWFNFKYLSDFGKHAGTIFLPWKVVGALGSSFESPIVKAI